MSVYAIYELDDNGEADYAHFYCSEQCRNKASADFIGMEHAYGYGDSIIKGTVCEVCEQKIDGADFPPIAACKECGSELGHSGYCHYWDAIDPGEYADESTEFTVRGRPKE